MAVVAINGQFPAGTPVGLWRVAGPHVHSHLGGTLVDTKRVDDSGSVVFRSGVKNAERYIAFGYVAGEPRSVRATGSDDEASFAQAPIQPDVVKFADGTVPGEVRKTDAINMEGTPIPDVAQVAEGTPLRVGAPRGEAHVILEGEQAPYPPVDGLEAASITGAREGQAFPAQGTHPEAEHVKGLARIDVSTSPEYRLSQGYPIPAGAAEPDEELKGEALEDRIKELDLKGLSGKTADEKRAAVAEAEAKQGV